jgi:hypothetical protein
MLVGWLGLMISGALAQEGTTSLGGAEGKPDFYVIQEGDTLWDISTRFLADPYAWPELWSVNEYITNPHWIYPGNRIYFSLGDALNPPSAGVEPSRGGPGKVVARRQQDDAEAACDLPVRYTTRFEGVPLSAPGVLADDDSLDIRGKVYKADVPGREFGEGTLVFLRMDDADDLECGNVVALYRRQGKRVRGPDGPLGRIYRVLGTAEVLRVDDDVVTARVRESWFEIERGDLVGTPVDVELQVDVVRPSGDLEATVVARLTEEQWLASVGETVFLDRGTNDGIEVGTSLFLVERRDGSGMEGKEDPRLPEQVVGRVVVVRAEPAAATGVVVDAARDVQVGARAVSTPNADD